MISRFTKRPKYIPIKPLPLLKKEKFNFSGGLDTLSAIEELAENASPYLRNARPTHKGTAASRKGPGFYSVPMGETADLNFTTATGAADQTVSLTTRQAAKYVAGATGRLTKVALNIKTPTLVPTAPIIIELWSSTAGAPGLKLATTSISVASVTSSYSYVTARFIEAPQVTVSTTYWVVAYLQFNGVNSYNWSSTTSAITSLTSVNGGVAWAATSYALNLKTWVSTDGANLGGIRFIKSDGTKYTLLGLKEAAGTTGLYQVNDVTGAITAVKSGLSAATYYRFAIANDTVFYTNGVDAPRQWDTTTEKNIPNAPALAIDLLVKDNRLWLLDNNSKATFSDAGDFTTYQSVSFLYIPTPKPAAAANSMFVLQNNLIFGTTQTKYTLQGTDLTSFVLRQAIGTKGIVTKEAVFVDGYIAYTMSPDGMVYEFNGSVDNPMGIPITKDLLAMSDVRKATLIVWNNQLRVYFPETGQNNNNAMFYYNLQQPGWFYDTNVYVNKAFLLNGSGDNAKLAECSSLVGAVYYAEQQYSDLGRPLEFVYYDKPESFGSPDAPKEIRRYYVNLTAQSSSYSLDCQMDKGLASAPISHLVNLLGSGSLWGTAIWGSFTWGQSQIVNQNIPVTGEYRYFQPRFVITGADTPVEIQGYTMYYLVKSPR